MDGISLAVESHLAITMFLLTANFNLTQPSNSSQATRKLPQLIMPVPET
jgi:hypothetical protein